MVMMIAAEHVYEADPDSYATLFFSREISAAVLCNLSLSAIRLFSSILEDELNYQNGIKIEVIILMTTFDKCRLGASCVSPANLNRLSIVVFFDAPLLFLRGALCYCNYLFKNEKIKADVRLIYLF